MKSQDRTIDKRRTLQVILLGGAGLAVLGIVGGAVVIPDVERHLTTQVHARLAAAGVSGVNARLSGQDATLTCSVALANPMLARQIAERVSGVRTATIDSSCTQPGNITTIAGAPTNSSAVSTAVQASPVAASVTSAVSPTSAPATTPASARAAASTAGAVPATTQVAATTISAPPPPPPPPATSPVAPTVPAPTVLRTTPAKPTASRTDATNVANLLNYVNGSIPTLFNKDGSLAIGASGVLDQLAAIAGSYGNLSIIIYGYTDPAGTASTNQQLSTVYATTMANVLQSRGVTATMKPVGRGSTSPIIVNGVVDAARSRRVFFVVSAK